MHASPHLGALIETSDQMREKLTKYRSVNYGTHKTLDALSKR